MDILVIALSINPRPLSALELKLSGLIMESRVDTAGDNQNAHVIIFNNVVRNSFYGFEVFSQSSLRILLLKEYLFQNRTLMPVFG